MNHRPAVVVGAGPAGLAAALALRTHGVPVTVLDDRSCSAPRPGSRAIFVHHESLQLLERLSPGLGAELAAHGLVWNTKRTYWRGREVFVRTYPGAMRPSLPPFTSLPQWETERFLEAAAMAAGAEILRETEVTNVESRSDAVQLETATGTVWSADFVVAADGARSTVRRCVGVPMRGSRSANSYVVVDVRQDEGGWLPPERVFHYEHPELGGRNVLLVPFAGGWRIDLQCWEHDDLDAFAAPDRAPVWLRRVLPERYAEQISWVSTYRFSQVIADDFTDASGRVLLVGEAAHLVAPFGARGMNSGFVDAAGAAAAIRGALEADSRTSAGGAIAEFAEARRQAGERNRRAAGAALAHMQARSPVGQVKRRLAALAARGGRRAGAWLDSGPYGPGSRRRGVKATF